jgi:hypothetical protein
MWTIHWLDFLNRGGTGVILPPIIDPESYETYQYLGPATFLTLPPVRGVSQFRVLTTFGFFSLPPDWDWTIRALREGRLVETGT